MKKNIIKYSKFILLGISVISIISGCNKENKYDIPRYISEVKVIKGEKIDNMPEISKERENKLVIGTKYDYKILNPIYSNFYDEEIVNSLIFSSLMNNKDDGTLEMNLLKTEPKVLDNGNKYKFTLKDNIKWSDGFEITTDDIEFTYMILFDESYNGLANRNILKIIGSDEYKNGDSDHISGIKKVDKKTIEISVEDGNARTLRLLNIVPLPKHIYDEKYKQGDTSYVDLVNKSPEVFSGPYRINKFDDKIIELGINENFFGAKPQINNIDIKKINDDYLTELKNGDIDIVSMGVNEKSINEVKELGFIDIYHYPNNGYGYIGLNLIDNPKLQNLNMRKALVYGLNREGIVKELFGEYGEVIDTPQSKISWTYTDEGIESYKYDKEKAIKLIEECGYIKNSNGLFEKNGEPLEIKFLKTKNNEVNNAIFRYAKENYEDIGIKFLTEEVDFKTLRKILSDKKEGKTKKNYDMFFMAWALNSEPDCTTIFSKEGVQNRTGYSNEKVDELVKQGIEELNENKRIKIYHELYRTLNDDVPYIYLYGRRDGMAVSSKVKNFNVSPYRNFTYDIQEIYIEG